MNRALISTLLGFVMHAVVIANLFDNQHAFREARVYRSNMSIMNVSHIEHSIIRSFEMPGCNDTRSRQTRFGASPMLQK